MQRTFEVFYVAYFMMMLQNHWISILLIAILCNQCTLHIFYYKSHNLLTSGAECLVTNIEPLDMFFQKPQNPEF